MLHKLQQFIENAWYNGHFFLVLLWPLEAVFRCLVFLRKKGYQQGWSSSYKADVPVIVVGNITVGGTGKTPLVIALSKRLQLSGYKPAIISRGYGSKLGTYPYAVKLDDSATLVGDEPLLLAQRTQVPVIIGSNRSASLAYIKDYYDCNVIISDDGLQHYAMQRDIEIIVVDAQRQLGNGHCLPAGPLRESKKRLLSADAVVLNNGSSLGVYPELPTYTMTYEYEHLVNLHSKQTVNFEPSGIGRSVHAIAGIGNPERFYQQLAAVGFEPECHYFPDHHDFNAQDIAFPINKPIIMTEKDAVKLAALNLDNAWFLPVDAQLDESFYTMLIRQLNTFQP